MRVSICSLYAESCGAGISSIRCRAADAVGGGREYLVGLRSAQRSAALHRISRDTDVGALRELRRPSAGCGAGSLSAQLVMSHEATARRDELSQGAGRRVQTPMQPPGAFSRCVSTVMGRSKEVVSKRAEFASRRFDLPQPLAM
jgi:hypothetical protein